MLYAVEFQKFRVFQAGTDLLFHPVYKVCGQKKNLLSSNTRANTLYPSLALNPKFFEIRSFHLLPAAISPKKLQCYQIALPRNNWLSFSHLFDFFSLLIFFLTLITKICFIFLLSISIIIRKTSRYKIDYNYIFKESSFRSLFNFRLSKIFS